MKIFTTILLTSMLFSGAQVATNEDPCLQIDENGIARKLRFVAIGDYGKDGKHEQEVSELIDYLEPEFIVTLGDNNYDNGSNSTIDENIGKYFSDYIFPYSGNYESSATENRFFPSLGNHDIRTLSGKPYLDYFSLPNNERYYQFTWGQTDFFVLNSNDAEPDGVGVSTVQAQWLQAALAQSRAEWKIVYFHHPPYSSGEHGNYIPIQWPFKAWGASFVISGHEHSYERLEINNFVYLIAGLGGYSKYDFRESLRESIVRYQEDYGVLLIEICKRVATIKFINVDKELIDHFKILHPMRRLSPPKLQIWKKL
jgi:tartrate-resistant acid phosphatase type 5